MLAEAVPPPIKRHETSVAMFQYHLVERYYHFDVPFEPPELSLTEGGVPHTEESWLYEQIRVIVDSRQALSLLPVEGVFSNCTVYPRKSCWRIRVNQVYLVDARLNDAVPAIPAGLPGGVKRHDYPTRKVILDAVARACRYPEQWLTSDPKRMVMLLNTNRGVRMSATSKQFRRKKKEDDDKDRKRGRTAASK